MDAINNKKIYVFIFTAVFFLFLLLIILLIIRRSGQNPNQTDKNLIPTSIELSSRTSKKPGQTSKTTSINKPKSIIPTQIIVKSNIGEDGVGYSSLYDLEKKTPITTDYFYINYDETTDSYIVALKGSYDESLKQFNDWLETNGLTSYINTHRFTILAPSVNYRIKISPTLSPEQLKAEKASKMIFDLIDIFMAPVPTVVFPSVIYPTPSPLTPTLSQFSPITPNPYTSNIYGNPLERPYYSPKTAVQCYTPANFNRVYANNSSTQNCYANVKKTVEQNLVRVDLLGYKVSVHSKVYNAFKAVNDELSKYQVDGALYKFVQGDYKFSYVGTYAFRCNVNASTTRDLCSSDCTLSPHSFGIAVDINPNTNCNGCSQFDMPPEVVAAFENNGFRWGGRYQSIFNCKVDAMHFEYLAEVCQ